MTTTEIERLVTDLDPRLAALEVSTFPVIAEAAEVARDAILRLLDILALAGPPVAAAQ